MSQIVSEPRIYRIAYISRASDSFDHETLLEIEKTSIKNNREQGIHGVLVTDMNRIIQVLEGDHDIVTTLLDRIRVDNRHHSLKIFAEDQAAQESFKQWFMGTINIGRRPPAMQQTFRSMFDIFENTPFPLSLDEQRIEFLCKLATWS